MVLNLNLKAHMDESYSDLEYVIGGYIASAETWAKFTGEWEKCLPLATRDKSGTLRFHMTDMSTPERMKRVPVFYKVIEDCNLVPIAARMDMHTFNRARERARMACLNILPGWRMESFGPNDKPYLFLFRNLMLAFHQQREKLDWIPKTERVDFIFDKGTGHEKFILEHWPGLISNQPEDVQALYGKTPDFADDTEVIALQAADFWAWWVRKWYEDEAVEPPDLPEALRKMKFDGWQGKPGTRIITTLVTEDEIFDAIMAACLRDQINVQSRWR